MAEQHITRTVTVDTTGRRIDPDLAATIEMQEAQYASSGKASFTKWDVCRICGHSFPRNQFRYINNAPYCMPNRCFESAAGA